MSANKRKPINVNCDECKKDFILKSEEDIIVYECVADGTPLAITYFKCPHCNQIYKVMIQDEECKNLREQILSIERKMCKKFNAGRVDFLKSIIDVKKIRLSEHTENIQKRYEYVFTLLAQEIKQQDQ